MCTIIIAFKVFGNFPLVVAANRDELLDRPSEHPQLREGDPLVLAPRDLVRGGTWIGVNESGVLVALTNRIDVKSRWGRMSRGLIVTDTLQYHSASEAFLSAQKLHGHSLNGFNMIIADSSDLYLLRGDGQDIHNFVEQPGLLVVSNQGVGRELEVSTSRRVQNVLNKWQTINHKPTLDSLVPLLDIHADERYGTCINEPENNYGTKSSSIVRLNMALTKPRWEYWHRERTSLESHVCKDRFDPMKSLTVQTRT